MFYIWFLWQFELSDIDINPPISQWLVTESTKALFVESFVNVIK